MQPRTFSLRYRPQTFEELFDQEHVKRTLTNAIERNRLAHAYLFAGPRGVGKTTTARILAKSLNCEQGPTSRPCNTCSACLDIKSTRSLDVLEIDGASNRGIDQIRDLRENIRYLPTSGRYRIYIIDEVHMLTTEAFNALLKTLEEPPRHVIFIFATTEPHKVPATILSRCQRFDFRRIPPGVINKRLKMIVEMEKLEVDDAALSLISEIADGGLRDAESILEQITTFKEGLVSAADITELLGIVPQERFTRFLELKRENDEKGLLEFIDETLKEGYDVAEFYFGLIRFLRALLFIKLGIGKEENFSIPPTALNEASNHSNKSLVKMLEIFLKSEEAFKRSIEKNTLLETLSLSLLDMGPEIPSALQNKQNPLEPVNNFSNPDGSNVKRSTTVANESKASSSGENTPASDIEKDPSCLASENDNIKAPGIQDASSLWNRFLDEISAEHSFLSLALKTSFPIEEQGNVLKIGISAESKLHLGLIEQGRDELEKRLAGIAGRRIRLSFEVITEESKTKLSLESKAKGRTPVEDVLDIFKGEII